MPFTSHGHAFGFVKPVEPGPPVARCGGPRICRKCAAEVAEHEKEPKMRVFHLFRHEDVSGVSGAGVVADGVVFDDGAAVLHWRGDVRSTAIYRDVEELLAIHGHNGSTELVYRSGPI